MNISATQVLVDLSTLVMSAGISAFIAGMRWGAVKTDLTTIDRRLAKIEGMFILKLKEPIE